MLRKDLRALRWRQVPPAFLAPWVLATVVAATMSSGAVARAAVAVYPFVVLVAALHLGVSRRVNPTAATAGIVMTHLAWSIGFWRGVFAQRP